MKINSRDCQLPRHIFVNLPPDELARRISRIDIIGLDVDNCLISGHGQIHLGMKLLPNIMLEAFRKFPAGFFLKLCAGTCGLLSFKLKKLMRTDIFNMFIMKCFALTLKGVEKDAFDEAVDGFDKFLRQGAEEAILYFSQMAPVILLSLGVEPVVRWLVNRLGSFGSDSRIKIYANKVRFEKRESREVFAGYEAGPELKNGKDKVNLLIRESEAVGAKIPMVVGHDENDLDMITWARDCGGVSVGFAPESAYKDLFDVVVTRADWDMLIEFLNNLVSKNTEKFS